MDDEAARDCQFPQRAEKEFLRLLARIAPRCQLEIPERPVVAFERGGQYCRGFRRRLTRGGDSWAGYSFLPRRHGTASEPSRRGRARAAASETKALNCRP